MAYRRGIPIGQAVVGSVLLCHHVAPWSGGAVMGDLDTLFGPDRPHRCGGAGVAAAVCDDFGRNGLSGAVAFHASLSQGTCRRPDCLSGGQSPRTGDYQGETPPITRCRGALDQPTQTLT